MRMSKWWFCVAAVCALGCGGDGGSDKEKTGKTGTAGGTEDEQVQDDGADDDAADEGACDPADAPVLSSYEGDLKWTLEDLRACQTACPPSGDPAADQACVTANCPPGVELFSDCVGVEVNACVSDTDSPCREEFAAQYCCAVDKCDVNADTATLKACLEQSCAEERTAYETCGTADDVLDACFSRAGAACLVPSDTPATEEPAPVDPAAAAGSLQSFQLPLSSRVLAPVLNRFVGRAQ